MSTNYPSYYHATKVSDLTKAKKIYTNGSRAVAADDLRRNQNCAMNANSSNRAAVEAEEDVQVLKHNAKAFGDAASFSRISLIHDHQQ